MAASIDSPAEVVVAGHVCLDVIPVLSGPAGLEPGRLLEIGPAEMSTGGAVPNIGLSLHRLGVPVRLMGKVGDDLFGSAVLEALRARDPELAADMVVGAGEITSYSIVISPPGVDRSFLHCSGANDTFTADDVRYDELASARLFHFGYPPIMRAMYADGGSELRRMLARARDAGPAISLDMCRPDPDGDAGRVDWRAPAGGDAPAGGRLRAEHRGAALHARPRRVRPTRGRRRRRRPGPAETARRPAARHGDRGGRHQARRAGPLRQDLGAGAGLLRSPVAERRRVVRSRGRVAVLPGAARRRDDRRGRLHDRGLSRRAAARRRTGAGGDQRDRGRRRRAWKRPTRPAASRRGPSSPLGSAPGGSVIRSGSVSTTAGSSPSLGTSLRPDKEPA